MNILIDINHPAHVHYYRNMATELEKAGHRITWTVKDMVTARRLLDYYGFEYIVLPGKSDKLISKVVKQLIYDIIICRICICKRIDIAIGTSVSIAHVSRILKVKSVVFDDDDDDVQTLVTKYVHPFADTLVSPSALKGKRNRADTIYYPGYHELAYLHPCRFTPDPSVLSEIGIKPDEKYFLLRFNVFKAHHDRNIHGLSLDQKMILVNELKNKGKIFITTEREIEDEISEFSLKTAPEKIHSLMYYSALFIGDSQTMTSEAAMLGVPSLRCNSFAGRISYLEEQEKKYGLTFAYLPDELDNLIIKLRELLSNQNLRNEWHRKRDKMLSEKIDVTKFWTWFIINYPASTIKVCESDDIFRQFINTDYRNF